MKQPKEKPKDGAAQSMIRKLTTEKAIKSQKVISADEITEIKLSSRGMKSIESLDLPSLRRLDLSKNQLNRLKGLQGCSQVTYLTAAGNELTGEGLDGVRPLRDLKVFNISSNRVRRIPPSVFANFRQLQALVMNNNEITEVPPSWLKKGLLSLNTLVLSHNKLKSLSASGLGRLTGLTKLSVSHNMLLELPDLSSCNGLEELRAAHNRISQVPASLAGNVALRTLDLGHNDINDWIGLESAGKTLTVLVQLTLAGNPVCGDRFSGAVSAEGEGEDAEAEVQGGEEYITKVRSLFPSLKVRDGKRVLMKKSHTFYQQRASGSDASSSLTTPPSLLPQQKRNRSLAARAKNSKPGRASVPDTEAGGGSYEADGGALKRKDVSNPNRKDYTECDQESRGGSSEKNVETGKAGRRLKKVSGAVGKEVNDKVESGNEAAPRSKRVDSGGRGKSGGQDKVRTSLRSKAKKDSKRGEESASELSTGIPHSDTTPERKSEEAVVLVSEGRRTDESDGKKSVQERPPKRPKIAGEKKEPSAEAADGGRHEDPYSSSEELPIPGGGTVQSKALVAAKGVGGGANRAISPAGASDSGVKEVVLHRKRKGSKMKISKKIAARGGASNQESEGNAADFSVDAMLQARGLRETLGLGSGMSAWD